MRLFLHGCTASPPANFKLGKVCNRRVSRLLSKAFVSFGFMALFGFISSPFSSPWVAIIYGIVQYCKLWSVALFRYFFTSDSCFLFNFFLLLQCNPIFKTFVVFSLKIPQRKDGILPQQTAVHFLSGHGRHVAWLRRRRRHAYAPTSNTASHDNHEKIGSWVSFFSLAFHIWDGYGAPLGGLRQPELR